MGAHQDVYGVPLVLLAFEVKLKDDPEEDPKEDFEDEEKNPRRIATRIRQMMRRALARRNFYYEEVVLFESRDVSSLYI